MTEQITPGTLCDWECGNSATHYFKYSKKYCCGHNVSKCPAKNKKMVATRQKNDSYTSGSISGLNTKRTTILSDGKTILEKASDRRNATVTALGADNESIATKRAKKMVETKRGIIDPETGLDLCKIIGKKQKETKNKIDPETGLTLHKLSGEKSLKTKRKKDENGLDWFDRVKPGLKKKASENGVRLHAKRIADIDEDGLDHYARRTKKMLEDVDEFGLNAFDRADKNKRRSNAKKIYRDSHLHYQCTYELKWLSDIEKDKGLIWLLTNVKNGPSFKYLNPIVNAYRYYISDFMIGNTIYEIKSSYTWNRNGSDMELEAVNKAKLQSVKMQGFDVILILDHTEIKQ